jgi:hypothetical protein
LKRVTLLNQGDKFLINGINNPQFYRFCLDRKRTPDPQIVVDIFPSFIAYALVAGVKPGRFCHHIGQEECLKSIAKSIATSGNKNYFKIIY